MKSWEEETKLEKKDKIKIGFYIFMVIFETIVAIVEKDFTWIVVALLWVNIAVVEYCNAKILKSKNAIIEFQDDLIKALHMKLSEKEEIIKLSDIIISKKFTKPKREKMKERSEYYREYKDFKVPIILDKNNVLIDGYTTYLIAKKEGLSHVYIERKR